MQYVRKNRKLFVLLRGNLNNERVMKRILIALMLAMPMAMSAQDNTWERIEQEPAEPNNPNAKYLAENAVPLVDGKVTWTTTIEAPGKSAAQIYDILLAQLTKMTQEPNQLENSFVAIKDSAKHKIGAVYHEWLVFKSVTFSLDRTQFSFQLLCTCSDGKAEVEMTRIYYNYDIDRKPSRYIAEEWITDEYAVNKKRTKLYPISGKFRRKTIDRKDFIFEKLNTLLNPSK